MSFGKDHQKSHRTRIEGLVVMHTEKHPLAGKTVKIKTGQLKDAEYRIEDWWDLLTGGSWGDAEGNPAALKYAIRAGLDDVPSDDEVLYGKIGSLGHLVHTSELGEELC